MVAIVILNWNQPAMTLRCVESARRQGYGLVRIIVVDNGSTLANVELLEEGLNSDVTLIKNTRNLGFADGMNVGIKHALRHDFEFIWLLNNDAFPEIDCLEWLVQAMQTDRTLAAAGPCLYDSDGAPQDPGACIDWESQDVKYLPAVRLTELSEMQVGSWLTGTALLFRARALEEEKGFDSRYFAYWEEVDLLLRLARKGHRFRVVIEARCLHLGSVTTGGVRSPLLTYLMARNAFLFYESHPVASGRCYRRLLVFARQLLDIWANYRSGNQALAETRLLAVIAGFSREYGTPRRFYRIRWTDRLTARVISRVPWRVLEAVRGLVQRLNRYRSSAFLRQKTNREAPCVPQ
jgi:GT2 family glycosyltransferase